MRQYQRLTIIPCLITLICFYQVALSQSVIWESARGPYSAAGRHALEAASIGIAPDGSLFVSGDRGLYVSTDNGDTWKNVIQDNSSYIGTPTHFTFSPSGFIFAISGSRIIVTDDNGLSWSILSYRGSVESLIVGDDGMLILGAGSDGLFTSSDDGQTWIQRLTNADVHGLTRDPISGDVFAVAARGGREGIYRSTDNGRSWAHTYDAEGFTSIAYDPASGLLLAATWRSELMRSTDLGVTWTETPSPDERLNKVLAMTFASNGDAFVASGYPAALYRSIDSGATWTTAFKPAGGDNEAINDVRINAAGEIFIQLSSIGVYRSRDNGDTWDKIGVPSIVVQAFALAPGGNIFAGTSNLGMYHSANDGDSWESIAVNHNVTSLAVNANGDILAGTYNEGVQISRDNGASWSAIRFTDKEILTLVANTTDDFFAGTHGAGIYKGSADGESWRNVTGGLPNLVVESLAASPHGSVFAGTRFNNNLDSGHIYRSIDGGENWHSINVAMNQLNAISVNAIAINLDGVVFYTYENRFETNSNAILRSLDDGATWETTNFPNNIRVLSLIVNALGHLYAGTDGQGVYRSTDDGATWEPANNGLTDLTIPSMTLNSSGFLFASTQNAGFFRSQQPVQITSLSPSSPVREALRQPQRVTLRWGTPEDAASYRIQVGHSPTFKHGVVIDRDNINVAFQEIEGLAENTTYFWRVGATDKDGAFYWSEHSVFSTGDLISSVDSPNGAGQDYVSRVAPNPFGQSTTIMFTTDSQAYVRLTITDLLGNTIATLYDHELPAGDYTFDWDAAELSDGTYFYTLQIGDNIETHKLLRR